MATKIFDDSLIGSASYYNVDADSAPIVNADEITSDDMQITPAPSSSVAWLSENGGALSGALSDTTVESISSATQNSVPRNSVSGIRSAMASAKASAKDPNRASQSSKSSTKKQEKLYPDLVNMEDYVFTHYRSAIVAGINGFLEDGDLSCVLRVPVITQAINRDNCRFTNYHFWRRNQTDYLIDIDVNIEKLSVEGRHGDYISTFGVYVSAWFHVGETFEFSVEEIGALSDRPDRDLVKCDQYLIPIVAKEDLEGLVVDIWNLKVPGAMEDVTKRKAFILADKYGLKLVRESLPAYDENHILCFQETTIPMHPRSKAGKAGSDESYSGVEPQSGVKSHFGIGSSFDGAAYFDDDLDSGIESYRRDSTRTYPAGTIVLNTYKSQGDEFALAIYRACIEYELLYGFYAINGCTDTRKSQIRKKAITLKKKQRLPKDPMGYVSILSYLGGFALMLPLKIMQDKVWREYQRACVTRGAEGYLNHDGFRYSMVIRAIYEDFQVARFRVRQRIIQMGRITAKGAMNYDYDNERYFTPFGFSNENADKDDHKDSDSPNKQDTSFTISRRRLLNLYHGNPDFRQLMATGDFAYIEGLVCINDTDHVMFDKGAYRMTAHANARADLCCLRFNVEYIDEHACYSFGADGYNMAIIGPLNRHSQVTLDERESYKQNLLENMPSSFPEALKYIMANRPEGPMSISTLAKRSYLSVDTVTAYCNNPNCLYELDEIFGICLGLNLPPWETNILLEKANMAVEEIDQHLYYSVIRDCLYLEPITSIQRFLAKSQHPVLCLENYSQH